ncbi:MAG: DUF3486 family protein [Methylicorpusculum sp.]|uniref:phage protein Gp27 family protein n=1 Tax=Methylicorpusculum sp. TaxID=2713644 RepID=UPI002715C8E3|nr:phage protein Gp27 family protein [Methylicorpusculum sp.]MDO8940891.1 DUF3486 family protein [Methylicorpusculum sp.]MDP2202418.1 DUF3486 family protein [Methylicorpusculum sp.]
MPPRPAITLLPDAILSELNQRLIDNSFSDYAGLSGWLAEQGFNISKTAVFNHGSSLQAKMEKSMARARERMEIAKALRGASDEDKAALMEANEMVAMDQIMDLFESVADMELDERTKAVPKLVRAIADLNRSAIGSSKWKREFEAEAKRQAREEAALAATSAAKAEGVSESGLLRIREALGMAA